jgi:D-alanyl-D-alanine dipeptidase
LKTQTLLVLNTLLLLSCTSTVEHPTPKTSAAVTDTAKTAANIRIESRKPDDIVDAAELSDAIEVTMVYGTAINFTGTVVPGYQAHRCYLQKDAAAALAKAAVLAKQLGYRLHLLDCYRPQQASHYFMQWLNKPDAQHTKASYYPNLSKAALKEHYIADYSSHSRASAVDLTLLQKDRTGQWGYVDMGSAFDFFDPLSNINSTAISAQQKANRLLLKDIMQQQGFAPYAMEWWHFTLQNENYPTTYFDFVIR